MSTSVLQNSSLYVTVITAHTHSHVLFRRRVCLCSQKVRTGTLLQQASRMAIFITILLAEFVIDDIINALVRSDLGCHIGHCYTGCLVYADNIILLSAALLKLQKMLDICFECGNYLDIILNAKKSTLFVADMDFSRVCDESQMGQDIVSWSHTLKYLGVVFKSACTVVTDVDETVWKFYASANAILSHVKYASEMSKLFLVETFSLLG